MTLAKRLALSGLAAGAAGLLAWILLLPRDWENWLGFSRYDYFTAGTNYAFFSGPAGPLLTALGMGTIIGGLWHAHNCHYDGCWAIGRHKVNGTPWCNAHQEEARLHRTAEDLLTEILAVLREHRA